MQNKFYVGRPNIGDHDRFLERVNQILDRRWLSNDVPMLQEFEERKSAFLRAKNVVVMCNATVALDIVFRTLDLKGEVILPSYAYLLLPESERIASGVIVLPKGQSIT